MTYLELAQRLRSETGIGGSGPSSIATATYDLLRLVNWINTAYMEIVQKYQDWKFLWATSTFSTVIGQRDYVRTTAFPVDLKAWDEKTVFHDTTLDKLEYIPYQDYKEDQTSWGSGTPGFFTILPSDSIRLLPTPSAVKTVTFDYWKKVARLAADADVAVIPTDYHDVIIHRAKMMWAEFEEAQFELSASSAEFETWMRRLEANQLPSRNNEHARARGADIVVRVE